MDHMEVLSGFVDVFFFTIDGHCDDALFSLHTSFQCGVYPL